MAAVAGPDSMPPDQVGSGGGRGGKAGARLRRKTPSELRVSPWDILRCVIWSAVVVVLFIFFFGSVGVGLRFGCFCIVDEMENCFDCFWRVKCFIEA